MDRNRQLKVNYDGKTVGTLALYKEHIAAFQYSEEWLAEGFSISPFFIILPKSEPGISALQITEPSAVSIISYFPFKQIFFIIPPLMYIKCMSVQHLLQAVPQVLFYTR